MKDSFQRFISLIGDDTYQKLSQKRVAIIGLGGVGGYVLEGLVRSGIQNFVLVDFDKIERSNLNRQILALNSTIGEYKVDVAKKRAEDINEEVKVEVHRVFLNKENITTILSGKIDYVIDAIDSLDSKVALIKYAKEKDLNIISSTGTAKKFNPSALVIKSLNATSYDPLAKKLRYLLRLEKVDLDLKVLASTESPMAGDGITLGSTAFVPSVAGLTIASYVVKELMEVIKNEN